MAKETRESLHEQIEALKIERGNRWRELLPDNINELPEDHEDVEAFKVHVQKAADRDGEELEDDEVLRRAQIQAAGRQARLAEMHPDILEYDRQMAALRQRWFALEEE